MPRRLNCREAWSCSPSIFWIARLTAKRLPGCCWRDTMSYLDHMQPTEPQNDVVALYGENGKLLGIMKEMDYLSMTKDIR
jgi:hypothetical protein